MAIIAYLVAILSAMQEEMHQDDNVFVLGEDVGKGGVLNTTKGLSRDQQMLMYTDKPIGDIAVEAGFSSFPYFVRCFKKHQGMKPRAYRQKYRIHE